METVGNFLRSEREAKNMSLSDASRITCIAEYYLGHIERDEFDKLPQGPYIKGYLALYSRSIGTDVDKVLDLYESLNLRDKQIDDFRLKRPPQEGASISPPNDGISVFDPKSSDPSATSPDRVSTSVWAPIYRTLKTGALGFARKCAFMAAQTVEHITEGMPKGMQWVDAVIARVKERQWPRYGLYLCSAVVGIGILVLAAFGFYHLFVYTPPPPPTEVFQQPAAAVMSAPMRETVEPPVPSKAAAKSTDNGQPNKKEEIIDPAGHSRLTAGEMPLPPNGDRAPPPQIAAVAENPSKPAAPVPGVNVVKASVCSGIKDRMPIGVDTVFADKTKRIYVWSQIQAKRAPDQIKHIYYFNGHAVSEVVLNVGSTHWRTWSYLTSSNRRYRGDWRVDITAADGTVLRRLYFKID